MPYPTTPGYKRPGTSQEAAERVNASTWRERVLSVVERRAERGATAEEVAAELGVDIRTVAPRLTELGTRDLITDSYKHRRNQSGRRATVWLRTERQRRDEIINPLPPKARASIDVLSARNAELNQRVADLERQLAFHQQRLAV